MKRSAALEARSVTTAAAQTGGARRAVGRMVVRVVTLTILLGVTYVVFRIATA